VIRPALTLQILLLTGWGCSHPAPPPAAPKPVPSPDTTQARRKPEAPAPEVALPVAKPARIYSAVGLSFVGDINLGTSTLADGIPPDSGRGLLDRARSALTGDLVVGNFEGVLADSGTTFKCGTAGKHVEVQASQFARAASDTTPRVHRPPTIDSASLVAPKPKPAPKPKAKAKQKNAKPTAAKPTVAKRRPAGCYAFLTPVALAPRLKEAGFTHLNLANNHANDFGPDGRASTDSVLRELGIHLYGPREQIAIDSVRRGDSLTVVALVGFTTYPFAYDLLDIERSAAVVDSVQHLADLVVATFHGGSEGSQALHVSETAESLGTEPRGELRRWARAVIDAGADAVIGHGPHVLRGIEFYRGKPIVYSLGNFLTYRGFNLSGALGITAVLQLEFGADRNLRRARLVPMVQYPREGPMEDSTAAAIRLVRQLSQEDFGASAARVEPDGEIKPPAN
jgi:Bacterial capsule synthesis protein PGA_cap